MGKSLHRKASASEPKLPLFHAAGHGPGVRPSIRHTALSSFYAVDVYSLNMNLLS